MKQVVGMVEEQEWMTLRKETQGVAGGGEDWFNGAAMDAYYCRNRFKLLNHTTDVMYSNRLPTREWYMQCRTRLDILAHGIHHKRKYEPVTSYYSYVSRMMNLRSPIITRWRTLFSGYQSTFILDATGMLRVLRRPVRTRTTSQSRQRHLP